MGIDPLTRYISTMALQSGGLASLALQNPFFPGNYDGMLNSLGRYEEDAVSAYGGGGVQSDEFIYHNFSHELDTVARLESRLRDAASGLEGPHASRAGEELALFQKLLASAKEANSRLPRRIDTSTCSLPDLQEESESFQRVRKFLNGRVSLARLALEGRDPGKIYFDLDTAEMVIALGLSTFPA